MTKNVEDDCLIELLEESDRVYIVIEKEKDTFKLYVNEFIVAETLHDEKHLLKIEGIRIKKLLNKLNIKVKTNLH